MKTIWLEVELDVGVCPELHSALHRIATTSKRAERLRQLATAGLIWESVRASNLESSKSSIATSASSTNSEPVVRQKPSQDQFIPTLVDVVELSGAAYADQSRLHVSQSGKPLANTEPPSVQGVSQELAGPVDKQRQSDAPTTLAAGGSRLQRMRAKGFFVS